MYHKKLVLIGDSAVGKTSIVSRYIYNKFYPESESTIGAAFVSKTITAKDGTPEKVEIWDTAGQERYRSLVPMYYRSAAGAIVVYDATRADSLISSHKWIKDLQHRGPENIKICLVGNKCDLLDSSALLENPAKNYNSSLSSSLSAISHYYVSAKTGLNIDTIFKDLIANIPRIPITDPTLPLPPGTRCQYVHSYLCC